MFEPIFKRRGYTLSLECEDWRKEFGPINMSAWTKNNNRGQVLLHFFARDRFTEKNITISTLIDESEVEITLKTLEGYAREYLGE